jgi:hypothetical protein
MDVGESVHRYEDRCRTEDTLACINLYKGLSLLGYARAKAKDRSHLRGNGGVDRGLLTVASAPLLALALTTMTLSLTLLT